jgi:hypothetical protein
LAGIVVSRQIRASDLAQLPGSDETGVAVDGTAVTTG